MNVFYLEIILLSRLLHECQWGWAFLHTCAGAKHGCCDDVVAVTCLKRPENKKQYHSPPLESHRHSEFKAAATRNKDGLDASVVSGAVIIKADSAAGNILEITPRLFEYKRRALRKHWSEFSADGDFTLGARQQKPTRGGFLPRKAQIAKRSGVDRVIGRRRAVVTRAAVSAVFLKKHFQLFCLLRLQSTSDRSQVLTLATRSINTGSYKWQTWFMRLYFNPASQCSMSQKGWMSI